tara:strand:- start:246 stop:1997 length:1752 start_codon:yes stop_codon:yes gene_type:complete
MKKILFLVAILISSTSYSQELDKNYLDSLPDSVRADIEDKMDARDRVEEPVYRRASTFIDKDEDEDEEDNISTFLFGSNFFDVMQTSFMPVNEPNLDPSYILDFGDTLEIQLVGQKNEIDTFTIMRDGSINLPDIGKIFLSGLPMSDASSLIKARINSSYIGTNAYISLKNIRDINVLVVGNAFNPGIYTLNGNSNMLHALSMAGGINDIGSYRNIDLIRAGKIIDTLDIYEVLIFGKYNFSTGLRSGDSIVVNPREMIVSFESGVMRPAIYELKIDESFEDLLKFANGYSMNNDYDNIVVKRIASGKSEVINLDLDSIGSFKFLDNDSIFIREFKINSVLIQGSVMNPGTYKFNRGITLSEAIKNAGGYDKSAYPFGAYLENLDALEVNRAAKDMLYDAFLTNVIMNSGSTSAPDQASLGELLLQLKEAKSTGRVIAEFDLDIIANDPYLDTILQDGDRIFVPEVTQQVYVQGEVSNPGAIRYVPGKSIDFYINRAGGTSMIADKDSLFVVHPNGETQNLSNKSRLSFIQEDNDLQLIYPGSIIYVPQKTNFANSLQTASIWAPIISSVALSLTSLSVLNNN